MIALKDNDQIMQELALRAKTRRLIMRLTQAGLANRAGVSLGSLKRFERQGFISLESLLKLARVLDCLEDFERLLQEKEEYKSLDEVLKSKNSPKRGSIK
ncbi:MAG: helix-turn-helix transcriptional regulator [Gammaproteobacteria bacterium]|nr:helix-turn-helix transcriptional regulator [Gammaproteobacteria bacterium]